ncbi:MAG: hypothetical protein HC877_17840 [Thioploca sp.]|nr:hypothetical protein [Thioploca sp.]
MMQQNSADALILAVLCDFQEIEPRTVVREILHRLMTLQPDDPKGLREYLSMLEVLASNRDLNLDIKQEFEMLEIEIERLPSFLIGEERGFQQGIERGIEQGIERGIEQGLKQGLKQGVEQGAHDKSIAIAKQLLKLNLSKAEIVQMTGLTVAELEQLNQK